MSRLIALIALWLTATPALAAPERYEIDKSHTRILFFVSHLGFSDMVGDVTAYDGHFTFDLTAPQESTVDITVDPAGIRTSSSKLDEHLQAKDFFNTAQFPSVRFVSTGVKVTGTNTADVTGNLTMLGVTKPVVMKVRLNKADVHPMSKDFVAGFTVEGTLKRSDFGMTTALPMVGDEVRVTVQLEGVNADRKKSVEEKKN